MQNKKKEHIGFLQIKVPENRVNVFYNTWGAQLLNSMNHYKLNPNHSKKASILKFFTQNQLNNIYRQYPKITNKNSSIRLNTINGRPTLGFQELANYNAVRQVPLKNSENMVVSQLKSRILNRPTKDGSYLYLLSGDDDKIFFIPVENQIEVYGKHLHIVLNKNINQIDAAGEIKITNGELMVNPESGTFMVPLPNNVNKYINIKLRKTKIKNKLRTMFPNKTVKFTRKSLLPFNANMNYAKAQNYLANKANYISIK